MSRRFLQPRGLVRGPSFRDGGEGYRSRPFRLTPELAAEYKASATAVTGSRIQILIELGLVILAIAVFRDGQPTQMLAAGATMVLGLIAVFLVELESRRTFLAVGALRQLAQEDGLTGLMNRRAFRQHANVAWHQAARAGTAIGIVLLDVDDFKQLNDRHGHEAGDRVLEHVAAGLREHASRPLDAIGRFGGDEFVVLWHDADADSFQALARLLPAKLWKCVRDQVHVTEVTVSAGAAFVWPGRGGTVDDAIRIADDALHAARARGRGVVEVTLPATTGGCDGRSPRNNVESL